MSACGHISFPSPSSPIQLYPAGPANVSPAPAPLEPRGSGSACESDGDDSDGQGAPQGGGGVQSTPVSARAAEILRGLRGLEASFTRK